MSAFGSPPRNKYPRYQVEPGNEKVHSSGLRSLPRVDIFLSHLSNKVKVTKYYYI
jgi:hypothetical protein